MEHLGKIIRKVAKEGVYYTFLKNKNLNEIAKRGDNGKLFREIYRELRGDNMRKLNLDGLAIFNYYVNLYKVSENE